MRKITQKAIEAFEGGYSFKSGNTEVDGYGYRLHGNTIARKRDDGLIEITLAGWNTNTTRERLDGLRGVSVRTKLGQAFLNGKKWEGSWTVLLAGGEWQYAEDYNEPMKCRSCGRDDEAGECDTCILKRQ